MYRITLKQLWANKVRFALTTFGVVLAVSFVVSAFVLADGLRSTFTGVSEEITGGIDLEVRGVADLGDAPPLPMSTVDTVAGVAGVADAVATIESADNAVRPFTPAGGIIPTKGPPQLAFGWVDNPRLSAFQLVDGSPPGVDQFTMDVDSARRYGFAVGDTYEFMVPDGRAELTMSGTTSFGADNSTLGAVLMQMHTSQAGELFGLDGIDAVAVELTDGAEVESVRAAIAAAVPTAEVVDHDTVLAETTTQFTDQIDLVGNILVAFGVIALLVSIFIVHNTFGIVLSQRTKELALLRSVGADPRQIRRAALGEALVMGTIASLGGIAGGVAIAHGVDKLFTLMGVDLSDWPVIMAPRTVVAAVLSGIGATLLAALGPARHASSVPVITALRDGADVTTTTSRRRLAVASALVVIGVVATFGGGIAVAGGLAAVFLGVTILAPTAVGAVTRMLGWPARRTGGVTARLAQLNAARNPRRTATTAAALTIGLTLVTTALVVADSMSATVATAADRVAIADYYVSDDLDEVDFPATLAPELRELADVDAATGFTTLPARIDGDEHDVVAFDFAEIDRLLDLGVHDGTFGSAVEHAVAVSVAEANARGIGIGDRLDLDVGGDTNVVGTIVATFEDRSVMTEDYLVDSDLLVDGGVEQSSDWIAVSIAPDATPADVDQLVAGISERFPNALVETPDEFADRIAGAVEQILTMVNLLVGLAVVIALIGIANTIGLSVFERTRELGLMRAIGMTPRQLRRTVRHEAALVAMFGASLGVGLGLFFGYSAIGLIPDSLASRFSVPTTAIVVEIVVAGVAGTLAAWLPARRAGRLDVLDAIA